MLKKIKRMILKWRLRRAYRRYCSIADEYNCGITMIRRLSSRFCRAESQVNDLMAALKNKQEE